MKKTRQNRSILLLVPLLMGIIVSSTPAGDYPLAKKVNPFIGTGAHGHTYPGVSMPFGMVQLSPDTDTNGWDWCSGYHYTDDNIMGFSHTHLDGTGCADLGDFLFMPTTGELKFQPGSKRNPDEGYRSRFSHDQEKAFAGFYGVTLKDYNIDVELTATPRVGVHKYTYPATKQANVIIDLTHAIGGTRIRESKAEIVGNNEVRGYIRKSGWSPDRFLFFVARFSQPFNSSGLVVDDQPQDASVRTSDARNIKGYVRFDTTQNKTIIVKVALSAVSWEGAIKNLEAEAPGWDFNALCDKAQAAWQNQLSKISVKGQKPADETVFYTALYRCSLTPNLFIDVDGQYRGTDRQVHQADGFDNYTVFSLWDTFRAEMPLFTILDQKRTNDFINSMIGKFEQRGLLPYWELHSGETWCMIGYHAIPPIVDAWIKGIHGFDIKKAYLAMKTSAMQDHQGMKEYKELGYAALDKEGQSASRTMEYSFDDWCISQIARELDLKDDTAEFSKRAQYFRNIFDRSIGFVRAKDSNGNWKVDFNPDHLPADGAREFTEGNSWHYTFFAPQDVNGLIDLLGGDARFIAKMDELFTRQGREHVDVSGLIGQYAQGNEPCHNYAYLYTYAGAAWKTQEKVAQIVSTLFTDEPEGLCGNNDCGQMSAWYVFSALGFYPVCPGQPVYVFGTPHFKQATINLESGKAFNVIAKNISPENIYIQSVTLNGKPYSKAWITHTDVMAGGELVFTMGPKANKQWGSASSDRPHSPVEQTLTLMPYLIGSQRTFMKSLEVELKCDDDNVRLCYTTDGSEPTMDSPVYHGPFVVNEDTTIKARAFKKGAMPSMILTSTVTKLVPRPAKQVDSLESGLEYSAYDGNFQSVQRLNRARPTLQGKCDDIDIKLSKRSDNFGMIFTGYYKAPEDGLYTFWTRSDDGSCLYLDGDLVVDNDGMHSASSKSGQAALQAGLHELKVLYIEGSVDEVLEVYVQTPSGNREKISPATLFRKK